jgi:chorismate mutase
MTDARGGAGEAAPGRAQTIDAATAELAHCREEIERIDNEIIGLLSRRLALGKRTATLKRAAGLPILDPTREAAVIRRVAGVARDAGLPSEPIREVFWQIVGMSRRAQQEEGTGEGGGGGTASGSGAGQERAP